MPAPSDTIVVSNRGPLRAAGSGVGRAAGGLVVALGPGAQRSGALWLAAAQTDADRELAGAGEVEAAGFRVGLVDIAPARYRAYYEVVANSTLWYLNHGLWDLPRRPRFDRRWREAWADYRAVNRRFADEVATRAAPGATVLVQDYHLALAAGMLAADRPDLALTTFIHTPWATPEELAVLPDEAATELIGSLAAGGPVGFHSARWADRYRAGVAALTGAPAPADAAYVAPAATDLDDLVTVAEGEACAAAGVRLEAAIGGRQLIARADRIELSKNIVRGLWAFDQLLEEHPEHRGRVVFVVSIYPSRQTLADYLAYGQEITATVDLLNDRWGGPDWTPILLDTTDDHPGSVAALRRYDVLLVNPVRDGLNLVAVEGPAVNDRDGVVVLSSQAGSADFLAEHALVVNPFDVYATAGALHDGLVMAGPERAGRAAGLRKAAGSFSPHTWWDAMVAAARSSS